MNSFSHSTRSQNLASLTASPLDLLVIGGGVTGTGIAWDAALRGLRVGLLEKEDFGSGTSGRSARLIHGGLRYLAHFQIGLVYESSRERRTLLRIAPHLVRPLPFLYPLYKGGKDRRLKIRAGMWVYDGLSLFRNIHIHRMLNREETLAAEPCVDPTRLLGAAEYYDAHVDDARLALATALAAHRAGALLANHVQVTDFLPDEDGRIGGVSARDLVTGEQLAVSARVVVNATGAWADKLMGIDEPQDAPCLYPTKGVHIVVDRACFGNSHAIVFISPRDDRMLFLVPCQHLAYIGTTDTEYDGNLDRTYATAGDVDYLLEATNRAFPGISLSSSDIISTWAGVRPLIGGGDAEDLYDISREHEIFESESGLISIAGGKLTTYRHMAEQIVDRVVAQLLRSELAVWLAARNGRSGFRECATDDTALDAAPLDELHRLVEDALTPEATAAWGAGAEPEHATHGPDSGSLSPSSSLPVACPQGLRAHLVARHGSAYGQILERIAGEPSAAAPIVPDLPYVWAEVDHALAHEMALSLPDMLVRRIPLIQMARDQGLAAAEEVALRMAGALRWDDRETARQVAAYREEVALTRRFRS